MGYRFKITSKQNNLVLGTGCFRTSEKMNKEEQLDFFHKYTNKAYFKNEQFLIIEIFEETIN